MLLETGPNVAYIIDGPFFAPQVYVVAIPVPKTVVAYDGSMYAFVDCVLNCTVAPASGTP